MNKPLNQFDNQFWIKLGGSLQAEVKGRLKDGCRSKLRARFRDDPHIWDQLGGMLCFQLMRDFENYSNE